MAKDAYFSLESNTKTRNLGLVMSLILVPMMLGFIYLDHVSPRCAESLAGESVRSCLPFSSFAMPSSFSPGTRDSRCPCTSCSSPA